MGDVEGRAPVALRLDRIVRALGVLDREPAELGRRLHSREQSPRTREPARGGRALSVDAVLRRKIGRHAARAEGVAAPLIGEVGLAAPVDRSVALAEPPERLADAVESVGVLRVVRECRGERVTRSGPIGLAEEFPGGLLVIHPT